VDGADVEQHTVEHSSDERPSPWQGINLR